MDNPFFDCGSDEIKEAVMELVLKAAISRQGEEDGWKPMHMQPVYEGTNFFGSGVCEKLFEQGLCLPSGSNLTEQEFQRIFIALGNIFKK